LLFRQQMLSIVIVNYNTFEMTCQCIESILQCTNGIHYEIILVDNASTECEAELFKNKFPSVQLVKNPKNNGFAKGNNLGIQYAGGETILLLNSDTYFEKSGIDNIRTAYEYFIESEKENVGVMSIRQLYPDGKFQHNARRFKTIKWEILDLFRFLPYLMSEHTRQIKMLGKYFDGKRNIDCDWVSGAFFMFRKKIIDRLPDKKLNDDFFMYGEDCQWCYDIGRIGYLIRFFSGSAVYHLNRGSSDIKKEIKTLRTIMKHELILYKKRGNPLWKYFIFMMIYVPKEECRFLIRKLFSLFYIRVFR
jgi:GT2 family glycosyltransferase